MFGKRWWMVSGIGNCEAELVGLADQQLRKRSLSLRYRAKSGEPLSRLLVEGFALVREAGRRTLDARHYDVQLLGGIAMHHSAIAEMQTGEGKTLTATLPIYLAALSGKGAHLATANDYLARRDAEWMGPLYELLGLSVGVVESETPRPHRRQAYQCDVTYGTAKEFGFDYLRDRLLLRQAEEGTTNLLGSMLGQCDGDAGGTPIQREPNFALVDEADSILIDEASTPMVIGALPDDEQQRLTALYVWAAAVAGRFEQRRHYDCDCQTRSVTLEADGRRLVRDLPKPDALREVAMCDIYEFVERAIRVQRDFVRDRQYILRDGEVVIVDEFTGRLGEGRKWRAGIHQAIEAKEGVKVTVETGQAARITVQDYFLHYPRLAGMTGTAADSARELRKIYGLRVVKIPTNRPPIRRRLPESVFGNSEQKWRAIVEEVFQVHATGRPVLIGTRSIDKSEHLSWLLAGAGIEHQVLNARHVAKEAEIVAAAGQPGRVTVSTNMAGRGTDVKLGDGVAELGGLHVICTELHDSARIDRQLIGRCGRQGDPGTYRQYLALQDDILPAGLGAKKAELLQHLAAKKNGSLSRYVSLFRRAQASIERRCFNQRRLLMHHENERKKTQTHIGQDPYLDTPG